MKTLIRNHTPARHIRLILTASLSALLGACATETIVYERVPAPADGYEGQAPATTTYDTNTYSGSNYGGSSYGTSPNGVITVQVEPPLLPEYEQPPCPQDGYLWTPGYWAWNGGYYWVPGTWVGPPVIGFLWTPAYWAFTGGFYVFHAGYWGPHVGFYGGINYGGGYNGSGYHGGRWDHGHFAYNTAVTNVNTTIIHNTYNVTVVNNNTGPRVSHNGGVHGTFAMPTAIEQQAEREHHAAPTPDQIRHLTEARENRGAFVTVNQGHPPIAATARPAIFSGAGVVPAHVPTGQTPHPWNGSGGNAPYPNNERNTPNSAPNNDHNNGRWIEHERPTSQPPAATYPSPAAQPTGRMEHTPGSTPSAPVDTQPPRPEMAAPHYVPTPRYEPPMQRPEAAAPRPQRAEPHYEITPPRTEIAAPRPEAAAPRPTMPAARPEMATPRPAPAPTPAPAPVRSAPRNAPDKEKPEHDKR